jgi:Ubiquitin carboxyl-terminal hydrolase
VGAIFHEGDNADAGHYITVVSTWEDGDWYLVNDSEVSKFNKKDIFNGEGYNKVLDVSATGIPSNASPSLLGYRRLELYATTPTASSLPSTTPTASSLPSPTPTAASLPPPTLLTASLPSTTASFLPPVLTPTTVVSALKNVKRPVPKESELETQNTKKANKANKNDDTQWAIPTNKVLVVRSAIEMSNPRRTSTASTRRNKGRGGSG